MSRFKPLAAIVGVLVSGPLMAQQVDLQRCAAIEDSLERLVCYDNLAEQQMQQRRSEQGQEASKHGQRVAEQARQKGQQMRAKKAQKSKDEAEQRFGLEHKNADEMDDIDKLVVEIANRRQDPYGNWVITLKNGQVWKQTESVGYFSWDDNDTYYIERGALNSFFFGREGANRRFRVTRVN